MPYDPNIPQAGTEIDAVQMRGQLNGLKDLIDAVPTITSAVVDAVNTLPPGDPATVSASVVAGVLHLSFSIPEGMQGIPGPQGPPFANAIVDAVTTLAPGNPATVGVSFDGTYVHFTFGIPQGFQGDPGPQGEVTTAALNAAISATSNNSNAVATMGEIADGSYNSNQMQNVINKMDELINALRRF